MYSFSGCFLNFLFCYFSILIKYVIWKENNYIYIIFLYYYQILGMTKYIFIVLIIIPNEIEDIKPYSGARIQDFYEIL